MYSPKKLLLLTCSLFSTPLFSMQEKKKFDKATKDLFEAISIDRREPWYQLELIKDALKRGADVHYKSFFGDALNRALSKNNEPVALLLIEHGTDVNRRGVCGATPLHEAAERDNVNIIHRLKEKGAEIDAPNDDGLTPLHSAAVYHALNALRVLIQCGANVNAQGSCGITPLIFACGKRNYGDESDRENNDVIRELLKAGALVNSYENNSGDTPLTCAVHEGNRENVKILLAVEGVDLEHTTKHRGTSLDIARKNGNQEMITLLEDALNAAKKE
jgi:ankyrin repeat protein